MRKRKLSRKERYDQMKREHENQAPLMKEKFPAVARLLIAISFTDHDNRSPVTSENHEFFPHSKAWFYFPCPFRECIEGGHDLAVPVLDMLQRRQTNVDLRLRCRGWMDEERINRNRCLLESAFTMTADYSDNTAEQLQTDVASRRSLRRDVETVEKPSHAVI